MTETTYGIISDAHQKIGLVKLAIENFKSEGINKLILNGDISNDTADSTSEAQKYLEYILETAGKSGLETFIQPGSHEVIGLYEPLVAFFANKYPNIIDTIKNPKMDFGSHQLVFLPGSDHINGEYIFGNTKLPTGEYVKTAQGLIQIDNYGQFIEIVQSKQIPNIQGVMQYQNINDLRNLLTNPDKTILVCHVPRKFDNVANGIDSAHFVEGYKLDVRLVSYKTSPKLKEKFISSSGLIPAQTPEAQKLLSRPNSMKIVDKNFTEDEIISFGVRYSLMQGSPIVEFNVEKYENRGNEDLKNLYQELGITKAVSGHFHESGHNAHDSNGISIPQNTLVNELYWNSGCLDNRQTGILTVKDEKVKYRNITFE